MILLKSLLILFLKDLLHCSHYQNLMYHWGNIEYLLYRIGLKFLLTLHQVSGASECFDLWCLMYDFLLRNVSGHILHLYLTSLWCISWTWANRFRPHLNTFPHSLHSTGLVITFPLVSIASFASLPWSKVIENISIDELNKSSNIF